MQRGHRRSPQESRAPTESPLLAYAIDRRANWRGSGRDVDTSAALGRCGSAERALENLLSRRGRSAQTGAKFAAPAVTLSTTPNPPEGPAPDARLSGSHRQRTLERAAGRERDGSTAPVALRSSVLAAEHRSGTPL